MNGPRELESDVDRLLGYLCNVVSPNPENTNTSDQHLERLHIYLQIFASVYNR